MQCYIKLFSLAPTLWGSLYGHECIPRYCHINTLNISTLECRIWQHLSRNWTQTHLQKLKNNPEVSVAQLDRDIINASEPIHSFIITDDDEDSSLIWTILKHPGTYIGTINMIFVLCIGVYCFRFWIRPATPRHWLYSPVSLWHAIVDDDGEVASIYRHRGKVEEPVKPHRNPDLCIEWEAAWETL